MPLRPPRTNNANDALELMRRGDITRHEFAFDVADSENGVSYERTAKDRDGKEVWLRHVSASPDSTTWPSSPSHPAYEQTSVGTH